MISSALSLLLSPLFALLNFGYILLQHAITFLFKPPPPRLAENEHIVRKPNGRIAVIGAGITGVSSAAHAMAHNFDVTIYEAHSRDQGLGGIWANVNSTSGLQLNSLLYRFHPAVIWSKAFPKQKEILNQVTSIWKEYGLESRTHFDTKVTSVRRVPIKDDASGEEKHPSATDPAPRHKWLINDGSDGEYDAVIVTVGTCGEPKWIGLDGMSEEARAKADKGKKPKKQDEKDSDKYDDHAKKEKSTSDNSTPKKSAPKRNAPSAMAPGTPSYAAAATPAVTTRAETLDEDTVGLDDDHKDETDEEPVPESPTYAAVASTAVPTHVNRDGKNSVKAVVDDDEEDHHDPKKTTHFKGSSTSSKHSQNGDNNDDGTFEKPIVHSSELDKVGEDIIKGKTVVILGSGASGVEAAETAIERGAKKAVVVARSDKWIIPRNIMVDTLIAAQPFGRQMPLSFLWEWFLKKWQYHGVEDLVPARMKLFEGTPIVNDEFLPHVRSGKCDYVRGDPIRLTSGGVRVNVRTRDQASGTTGEEQVIDADVVVLATGFEKPTIDFLEDGLFPEGYQRPDLYLQNFSTEDWSVLMTNSSYMSAIGTVGHFHIGVYTRILLTLLLDEKARPSAKDMKLWVDVVRFIKRGASGGALSFFTYAELTIWLVGFLFLRPDRLRWLFFIMCGWGVR